MPLGDLLRRATATKAISGRSRSASSTAVRKASTGWAPTSGRPLMRNVGVDRTPSARACVTSASTAAAKRRSSRHAVNGSRARPTSTA